MSRIEALLVDDTAGDPMTGLKWSRKSTRSVSKTLAAEGVAASPNTVAACLKRLNFSLQRNRKSIGETRHPQRDQQFRHLSAIKAGFEDRGQPVISVDSKKRELVGLFLNPGQTWCWMGRGGAHPRLFALSLLAWPCPTASTTRRGTPVRSSSAPLTTPPNSPSTPSKPG